MNKLDAIEAKVRELVQKLAELQDENEKLRRDSEATAKALDLVSQESQNAKQILAEYRELKRRQALVAGKVEHALLTLQGMK